MPLVRVLTDPESPSKGILVIRQVKGEPQHVCYRPGATVRLSDAELEKHRRSVEVVGVSQPSTAPAAPPKTFRTLPAPPKADREEEAAVAAPDNKGEMNSEWPVGEPDRPVEQPKSRKGRRRYPR